MVRELNRLSPKQVQNISKPGCYCDALGLYLQVSPPASKSWAFRHTLNGKSRKMGLGPLHAVTLAEARNKAADCRKQLLAKLDPIAARDAATANIALDKAPSITFAKCAEFYIEAHRAGWNSAKHVDQWTNTVETYCGPNFGAPPVQGVDAGPSGSDARRDAHGEPRDRRTAHGVPRDRETGSTGSGCRARSGQTRRFRIAPIRASGQLGRPRAGSASCVPAFALRQIDTALAFRRGREMQVPRSSRIVD